MIGKVIVVIVIITVIAFGLFIYKEEFRIEKNKKEACIEFCRSRNYSCAFIHSYSCVCGYLKNNVCFGDKGFYIPYSGEVIK